MKEKKNTEQATRYKEIIELVQRISKTKGWTFKVIEKDSSNKYATISVSQPLYGRSFEQVDGNIHITVDSGVKLSCEKTSFYGQGLEALIDAIKNELENVKWLESNKNKTIPQKIAPVKNLEIILSRFHFVARQIKHRYNKRPALIIKDEYDVQYLLHSLLKIFFDDIRPEEHTPSSAGSSSRVDFLLKSEKIIIETKYATEKLTEKTIGEQLIIDIKKYQTHPDCSTLICFVYDPDGWLKNPSGLEKDLSGKNNNIDVKVIVHPKH